MNKSLRAVALQPFVLTTAITNTRHEYARLSTFTHDGTTSWYRQQQRSQSDGLRPLAGLKVGRTRERGEEASC